MSNVFQDVYDFHDKFRVFEQHSPNALTDDTFEYRFRFLMEELLEFRDAYRMGILDEQLDAMIDLIYVACGTMTMMGFSPEAQAEAWRRVQEANMEKMRVPSKEHSKRGSGYDVIKPEGWKPPYLGDLCR